MSNNSYYSEQRRDGGKKLIAQALAGYEVKDINQGYCFRVNGALDLYPTRGRFHNLRTNERGSYPNTDAGKLIAFVIEQVQGFKVSRQDNRAKRIASGECLFCGKSAKLRMCEGCKQMPLLSLNLKRSPQKETNKAGTTV